MSTNERPDRSVLKSASTELLTGIRGPEFADRDSFFGAFAERWEDMHDEVAFPVEIDAGGPMTKWDIRRLRTRRMLLHAGREIFATRGSESPKVEDVAKAAGISRAGFYLHFKSLEELMIAVFRREVRWQLRRYRTLTTAILQDQKKFRGWLRRFFASFEQERDYILIIYRTLSTDPSVMQIIFQEHDRMLQDIAMRNPELGLTMSDGSRNDRMFTRIHNLMRQIEDISLYSAFNSWKGNVTHGIDQICEYVGLIEFTGGRP